MGILGKFFKKEEKNKGGCGCSFNLEDEIAKVSTEKVKYKEESSCCDFNLEDGISKVKEKESCCTKK